MIVGTRVITHYFPQAQWRYFSALCGLSHGTAAVLLPGFAINCTETEMSSFWRNFRHWRHWKLSFWQLSVQPVMKISSKWWHFHFCVIAKPGNKTATVPWPDPYLVTHTHYTYWILNFVLIYYRHDGSDAFWRHPRPWLQRTLVSTRGENQKRGLLLFLLPTPWGRACRTTLSVRCRQTLRVPRNLDDRLVTSPNWNGNVII